MIALNQPPPLLRSVLYLPANRASAVAKARQADCDAVILDLEDAVGPEAKDEARDAAIAAASEGGFGERLLVVRANGLDSQWGAADLSALGKSAVTTVLLPKISSADDVKAARDRLPEHITMWLMLETCAAFLDLPSIAHAAKGYDVEAFVLGTNDLALEMRCTLTSDRMSVLPLLTQAVVAARTHDIAAIDGVFNDLADEAGLASECRQGAALGFDGKTAIHPRQLAAANAAFSPSDAALGQARSIAAAFTAPENTGKGVIKHEGRMAELLHLREAERIIAQAEAIARRSAAVNTAD